MTFRVAGLGFAQVADRAIQEFAGWSTPNMITRYDKRKTVFEKSAAHVIDYGSEDRVPEVKMATLFIEEKIKKT